MIGAAPARRVVGEICGALALGALPLVLAGVDPQRSVVATRQGQDPLLQSAILRHSLDHAPWSEDFWHAPWFWPESWAKTFMDPLLGQALLLRPFLPVSEVPAALPYNLAFVLTLALGAGAAAWLARRWGLSRPWAWLAAAVYTAGPLSAGQWHHLNQLPGPWLPLCLIAVGALHRRGGAVGRWGALLSGALTAQLSFGIYGAVSLGVAVAIALMILPPRGRAAGVAVASALLVFAVALWFYALPFRAAAAEVVGYGRDAADVLALQARPFDLWKPPRAHLLGWPAHDPARPVLYAGFLWSVLALLGVIAVARGTHRRPWMALTGAGLACFVLAFGRGVDVPWTDLHLPLPFAWLQDHLWPLQAVRGTSRLFLPAALASALLGTRGVVALLAGTRGIPARRSAAALLLCGAGLELMPGRSPQVRVAPDATEEALVAELRATPSDTVWMPFPPPCREREESVVDARAMLWALRSGRPVAGGSSGFVPPSILSLRATCCAGLGAECAGDLASHGVDVLAVRDEGDGWRLIPVASLPLDPGRR